MTAAANNTARMRLLLKRLDYYGAVIASTPLLDMDSVAETACTLAENILGYRGVIFHIHRGTCYRHTLKTIRRKPVILNSMDVALLKHAMQNLESPTLVRPGELDVYGKTAQDAGRSSLGRHALVAPFAARDYAGMNLDGYLVAAGPPEDADPDVDMNLLNILATITSAAVNGSLAFSRVAKTNKQLRGEAHRRSLTEQELRRSEERYRTVAQHNHGWEGWIGPDGETLYVSPSAERISGYPPERFESRSDFIEQIIHRDDLDTWRQAMADSSGSVTGPLDFRIFRNDGHMRWVSQVNSRVRSDDGRDLGVRYSIQDITERKFNEFQLQAEAFHDPLTGLANRSLCLNRISQAMERCKRRGNYHFAVIFSDLDRFKFVNDCFGHSCGDMLLAEFAQRLLRCVRGLDTVARIGGDEFILLLEELESPREAIRITKRLRSLIAEPFRVDNQELNVTTSLGIVLGPTDYSTPEALLRNASIALHRAKDAGRNRFKVFNSRMLDQYNRRMRMENDMRNALVNKEFHLLYQPIFSLRNYSLIGFEALARWDHPTQGAITPSEFIPLAEETGFIVELGYWALRQACSDMAGWLEESPNGQDVALSVNISTRQFTQPDLVEQIMTIVNRTGMPPEQLKLEITESSLMADTKAALDKINCLKRMGIRFSVDDFGTGYSSMNSLQEFPLDNLKIDLSFVRNMHQTPEKLEIVRAIINLAHNLGLEVVAEGVELTNQRDILASLRCDFGQGYLYSRPVPSDEARAYMIRGVPATCRAHIDGKDGGGMSRGQV